MVAEGQKNDQEKIRVELLSPKWLLGVGSVLTFGAKKYAAYNWRKGLERSRLLGAALRHILAYLDGEDLDQESGLSHLYHASCYLMFASELHETHPELDDRWKAPSKTPLTPLQFCGDIPKDPEAFMKEVKDQVDSFLKSPLSKDSTSATSASHSKQPDTLMDSVRIARCLNCKNELYSGHATVSGLCLMRPGSYWSPDASN